LELNKKDSLDTKNDEKKENGIELIERYKDLDEDMVDKQKKIYKFIL
jgi:hypothetical protein